MLGRYRFYFVGKEPPALWVAVSLLFANTVLMLLPESRVKAILGQWYAHHSIAIQFVLLAAVAATFIVFRKRVHHVRPG